MSIAGSAACVSVCIAGAAGRIGRRLARLIGGEEGFTLGSLLDREGVVLDPADLGLGAGSPLPLVTSDARQALGRAQVLIDFTAPAAATALAPLCVQQGVAYLVASTGLSPEDDAAISAAAAHVAVLQAANLSLGVNIMLELAELAARMFGDQVDIEISEIHHRHKRDAPSGTALALARAVERGRQGLRVVSGRSGVGEPRAVDELGIAAVRGGEVAGEHTVYYFGETERLEITHRAASPDVFARGAIVAARWLVQQAAGRYSMRDVLATKK